MNWIPEAVDAEEIAPLLKKEWKKLTDDDIEGIGVSEDQLVCMLCARYGLDRATAEKKADEFGTENKLDVPPAEPKKPKAATKGHPSSHALGSSHSGKSER